MATLTIIKDDKFVAVDGIGFKLDAVNLATNVHAVQWDGSSGWIEYNDGTANESIDNIDAYSTITNDHATKKAEHDAAVSQAATDQAALGNQYDQKRLGAYASYGDQLDQLYHDMTAGKLDTTGEWHKGIKAVKDAHPKP